MKCTHLIVSLMVACIGLAATDARAARQGSRYVMAGRCAGLPAVQLKLAKGFCAGLAASGLGLPRGVLPLADGRVLVTDLGGWEESRGRLLALVPKRDGYTPQVLLTGLDRPHGLQQGPDGRVYLGEATRILRLQLEHTPPDVEVVIGGLPAEGRHPLKQFAFGPDGALYVNQGASTDHCENASPPRPGAPARCPEAERKAPGAALWRYTFANGRWIGQPHARGLRNSMALAFTPDGTLWQGENSRDRLPGGGDSETRPPDELNLIRAGAHYGWPYCSGTGPFDPTFGRGNCASFARPERLLPAHSAPLGMIYYDHPAAPAAWRRSLVVALHGYRRQGHRIVAWPMDKQGRPARQFQVLVSGWEANARHPLGAPTDVKADAAGRLWVSEDRNGTLLVISPMP